MSFYNNKKIDYFINLPIINYCIVNTLICTKPFILLLNVSLTFCDVPKNYSAVAGRQNSTSFVTADETNTAYIQ